MWIGSVVCTIATTVCFWIASAAGDEISLSVKVLQSVAPGGKGTASARNAVQSLAGSGEKSLLPVLQGFEDASPLAVNWLRNAFAERLERTLFLSG